MNKLESFDLPHGKVVVYDQMPNDSNLITLDQTHSNIIHTFGVDDLSSQADGIIFTNEEIKKYQFGIRTADCLPLVLVGESHSAVIHAGWRGIHNRIVLNQKILDISPEFVFIGPSIQQESFEVSKDFRDNFPTSKNFNTYENKLTFNLQQEIKDQLNEYGKSLTIIDCAQCTFINHKYNSYRRDKTEKRNWNIYSI